MNSKKLRSRKGTAFIYDGGGPLMDKVSGGLGAVTNAVSLAKTNDITSLNDRAKTQAYIAPTDSNADLMKAWSSYTNMNKASYSDVGGKNPLQIAAGIGSGAVSGASMGGVPGAIIGAGLSAIGGIANIFGTKQKQRSINSKIDRANQTAMATLNLRAQSLDKQQDQVLSSSFFAKGGPIHINPANRGKFIATKKATGKTTEELTHSKNPLTRKRAIFAQNAANWSHALGGELFAEGGDLSNGMTLINAGGTHEQNPNEGVQMGEDAQGIPNLVEQGEVKYDNYIYSNRLHADKDSLAQSGLPLSYEGHSFALIAERLGKESKERPNDPISKNGLKASMAKLTQAQELFKMKEQQQQMKNKFAKGGPLWEIPGIPEEKTFTPQMLLRNNTPAPKQEIFTPGMLRRPLEVPKTIAPTHSPMALHTPTVAKTPVNLMDRIKSALGNMDNTQLRYAPVVGSGLAVLSDLMGKTNKADYTNASMIQAPKVSASPIGNYLTYTPVDREYYLNKLNAESGAARNAIINQSAGNRATATAGILAADNNALSSLGDYTLKAAQYNQAQREQVEGFNRGTNQFNSQQKLQSDIANAEWQLKSNMAQASMREDADLRSSLGRSTNLTNLFDNLGMVGRENYTRNMVNGTPGSSYLQDSKGFTKYKGAKGGKLRLKGC